MLYYKIRYLVRERLYSFIMQQTCYNEAGASDSNASRYRLDDSKATSLQQTYWVSVPLSVAFSTKLGILGSLEIQSAGNLFCTLR